MNWVPSFSQPWAWALLAGIPIGIVLLYFLKLKREPVEVPSTYLWTKTIEDLHVNSLLQRLRRSLLLLLQLLAIVLAAIALFRPGIRGETSGQGRTVFLLDNSASMQATDVGDDDSRFQKSKRLIRERIDSMSDSDSAMLITFSDRPETVQSFTSDRRRLRDALDRVKITNQTTDILGALKAADGLANPRRSSEVGNLNDVQVADAMPADLLIFSDGGFQDVTEFSLGNLKPTYISMGTAEVNNVAVTAFSAERNVERPTEVQAFATVINLGSVPAETTATLSMNGEFLDAETVELEPGDQTGLSFTIDSEEAVTLDLKLDIEDDFELDNSAFAGLTPMRTVSVLVITDGNTPLRLGLKTEKAAKVCNPEFVSPSYMETDDYAARASGGIDDLIIYDRCSPVQMPATNTFFIGSLPPNDPNLDTTTEETEDGQTSINKGWSWATEKGSVVLVDVDRTHPLMRYLELFSLLIFSGRGVEGPPGSLELIGSDIGAVLVLAPRDGFQDMVLGFEIISTDDEGGTQTNTNWYAERSWPVFVLNVLRYLAGAAEATGAPSYRPGETVRLRLESVITDAKVTRVGGKSTTVKTGPSGVTEIVETQTPGNYRVESEDRLADLFAINLFDRSESDIAAAPSIELGYEAVEAATGGVEKRREYWRWALITMLGLIAAEWWVYSKRVG
ncbi:MAG: vWA domain-containing protein [Rubripirellula sp.]